MAPWARRVLGGSGHGRGSVRQLREAPLPPVGWVRPRARRFHLWALTFSPPGSRHPTR